MVLLVLLLGPRVPTPAFAMEGLFTSLSDPIRRSWQQHAALVRANRHHRPAGGPDSHFMSSSELDWAVFSGIGLEKGRLQDFGEEDLKLVRRRVVDSADQGEPWLQSLAWRRLVDSQTARDAASGRQPMHGHGVSLDVIHGAFNHGFSVVINLLNHRMDAVGNAALELSTMLGFRVNANLYLTPGNTAGFEAHFDWMESIIVQLEGRKTWQIYKPVVLHPQSRQKYKPRAVELGQPVQTVELRSGDMLYLPAGFPHDCKVDGADPSLHVTFGTEVDEEFTWVGALLTLWDIYTIQSKSVADDTAKCSDCLGTIDPQGSAAFQSKLLPSAAVAAAVYAVAEHEPLLRRAALPISASRDVLSTNDSQVTEFAIELLRMAQRVHAGTAIATPDYLDISIGKREMLEVQSPQDGWESVAALARFATSNDTSSGLKAGMSQLRLEGMVEVDSNTASIFADGHRKVSLELAAQRCAEDIRLRAMGRCRTSGVHSVDQGCWSESDFRLTLQRVGGTSRCSQNSERGCAEDLGTAQASVKALVSTAAELKAATKTLQELLASRDRMLREAAAKQRENLLLHSVARSDPDLMGAWHVYQQQ